MAGFTTDRPGIWADALLSYAQKHHVEHKSEQVKNNCGTACTEFKIQLKFMDTKHVMITIKMVTGYVSVKGADYQKWIDNEFSLVCNQLPATKTTEKGQTSTQVGETGAGSNGVLGR